MVLGSLLIGLLTVVGCNSQPVATKATPPASQEAAPAKAPAADNPAPAAGSVQTASVKLHIEGMT